MKCDLCCLPITEWEITHLMSFSFRHKCGRFGNYHVSCVQEVLRAMPNVTVSEV